MMDRYDVVYSQYFHGSGIGKKENGAYILHEDCKLRVEALSEILKNAEREAEEFRVKCVELEVENVVLPGKHGAAMASINLTPAEPDATNVTLIEDCSERINEVVGF
ncbi:MAG: hypothetical protein GY928_39335 [Colwellia sp.]|nr:hypothetical protein [Colwellia sp.]